MCDVRRCRNTDLAVIYAVELVPCGQMQDAPHLDVDCNEEQFKYEMCERCWKKHGNKPAREILALFRGAKNDD